MLCAASPSRLIPAALMRRIAAAMSRSCATSRSTSKSAGERKSATVQALGCRIGAAKIGVAGMSLACALCASRIVFIVPGLAVSPICKPETAPFNLATGALTCTTAKPPRELRPRRSANAWAFDQLGAGPSKVPKADAPKLPLPVKAGTRARANKAVPAGWIDVS